MAVMTFTRRQVVDMFPEYLTKRSTPLFPAIDAYATELGLTRIQLVALFNGHLMAEAGVFKRERAVFRSPYAIKWATLDGHWEALTQTGSAEKVEGGWRLTAKGDRAVDEYQRIFREGLRRLAVPADATRRAAQQMTHLASRIPPTAVRVSWARRRPRPAASEPTSDLIDLDFADLELWYFRDDCHVPAWEARGYDGPAFEVLSYVWPGPGDVSHTKLPALASAEGLTKALEPRQGPADVERNLAALVKRGDLAREGDGLRITAQGQRTRDEIEADTDRRYFTIWDLDDAATARLGDDLRSIIDSLPQG